MGLTALNYMGSTAFLTHLAQVRGVSVSAQNQALCALFFSTPFGLTGVRREGLAAASRHAKS
ncbi:MAG: hypothetical protein H0U19_11975 [Acidobacteria bacterium]|nr:hypothetical protein [Acidobacteriota bacterium]